MENSYDYCEECGSLKGYMECPRCSFQELLASGHVVLSNYTPRAENEKSFLPHFNHKYVVLVFGNGKELSFVENPGTQPGIQERVNSADRVLLSNDKEKALNYLDEEMQKRQENGF